MVDDLLLEELEDLMHFTVSDLPNRGYKVMEEIRRQGKLCDVTLKVGDHKFSAHRIVLAASIPYFHAMFTNNMMECKQDEIVMQGMDPRNFKNCLCELYGIQEVSLPSLMLHVGDHKFSAHRIVLAASIPYFHAMFTNNMMECKQDEIVMQGMDPRPAECAVPADWSQFPAAPERQGRLLHLPPREVGDHKFSAHRIVLAASIPYFHAMFTNNMMECKQDEIVMQGMDPRLHPKNCLGVRQFAEAMMCTVLYDAANSFVHQHFVEVSMSEEFLALGLEEVLELVGRDELNVKAEEQFAEAMMCTVLYDAANSFVHQHFVEVSMSEEFLALGLEEVLELVGRDELNVKAEEQVFEAVLAWVRHKRDQREPRLPELLSKTRLPLCRPQFLADRVQQEDLVRCCHKCRDLVDEAKDYHLMPERRPHLPAFKTRQRCCTSIAGLIYAVGGLNSAGDSLNVVEMFDPIANRWERCQPMTTTRSRVGVAVVNGLLYAIGGYDGQSRLSTVEVFNPETDTWTRVASMNSNRSAMGTVVVDGQIYVCGGYDGNSSLSSVECYSPESDKWTMATPMSASRSAAGVTVFEGRIYVSGGHDGLQIFNSMEYYNQHTSSWHPVAGMMNKRCRHGAAALGSKLYVAGGYDGSGFLSMAEVYSSAADQWSFLVPMNTRRSRVSLVANCGRLYAVGGYDGQSNLNSVEMYDAETNTWTFMAPMTATSPPDTVIREKRQVEANPRRRPRPCLGCQSVIGVKKEAPITDDRTKGKVKRRNCVKNADWTPTTNKPSCIKRPVSPGAVSLLEGDGEDAGGGQASTVWGRFDKGQEKVDRKKRSRNVLWSRTPLSGNNNDSQANAVWERIHGKTQNESCIKRPPGAVSLLEGDGEDAGGGQASTVWGRFDKGQEKVDRKKRSRNVLWSRTPLSGNNNDSQANAVWERIHGKTQNEKATSPPDTPIREKRQVEANPKRRPRPCLGCLSLIAAKKQAPVTIIPDSP
ncbi:UNVERIFIED_CONTAM: hypothetical protein FKN15_029868 [Acipenser sinensis]